VLGIKAWQRYEKHVIAGDKVLNFGTRLK